MLKRSLLTAAMLATLIAGPALAADSSAAAPEPTRPASAEAILPDEITDQFTPEPTYRYGMKNGPCTVSVSCIGSNTIRCSGQTICYWKMDSPTYGGGFVECDGFRTTCQEMY